MLSIDLGNSLPTQSPGGAIAATGLLQVALLPPDGAPVVLGQVDPSTANWYELTAGIVAFPLTPTQLAQAANTPLGIISTGGQVVLTEAPDGVWLRADDFVFRLDPGTTAATTFYMTAFGARVAGRQISLGYDASIMQAQSAGQPQSALTFPASITTGADGTATLILTASDPGNPRSYIDGQIYGVTYGPGESPPPVGSVGNGSQMLSALVWSGYTAPATPNWTDDVGPIFLQYANLYPVMKPIVDLSSFSDVVAKGPMIRSVLSLLVTDAGYMPVTRDLSRVQSPRDDPGLAQEPDRDRPRPELERVTSPAACSVLRGGRGSCRAKSSVLLARQEPRTPIEYGSVRCSSGIHPAPTCPEGRRRPASRHRRVVSPPLVEIAGKVRP